MILINVSSILTKHRLESAGQLTLPYKIYLSLENTRAFKLSYTFE